jgi:hypothetical protein
VSPEHRAERYTIVARRDDAITDEATERRRTERLADMRARCGSQPEGA